MSYKITSERIVSQGSLNMTLTGKAVFTPHENAGKVAVCVKLEDGRTAWGFADSKDEAERTAVQSALAI